VTQQLRQQQQQLQQKDDEQQQQAYDEVSHTTTRSMKMKSSPIFSCFDAITINEKLKPANIVTNMLKTFRKTKLNARLERLATRF